MSSYRGNDTFRVQMRPKGRVPFKHGGEQMQPTGRGRYIQGMQMPAQQSSPYPPSVGYHTPPRSNQYPPEYVQYPQQVAVPTPTWNQSIPITVSDSYQHPYQPQQSVYNPETTHMMTVQNNAYMSPVQNQNDYDPVTSTSICSKCGFLNTLALVQLRTANEEIKSLREQVVEKERQLEDLQQMHASYEDSPETTVQQSSLSVDAPPFQMASAPVHETYQVACVSANNPNGNAWASYGSTPVVSASAATSNYDDEPPTENDWDNSSELSHPQAQSEQQLPPEETEPPNADHEAEWDEVTSSSGPVVVSATNRDDGNNHRESEQVSIPPDDECVSPKEEGGGNEVPKSHPRDPRPKHGKGRGNKNDRQDSRDNSRGNYSRRGSGGSNTGYHNRPTSPHEQFTKSAADSRDSSHSRAKSGPEHSDKVENSPVEGGEKRIEPAERNAHEKRFDSNRRFSQDKDSPGDRGFSSRRGGRRHDDRPRTRGSDDTDWRNQDSDKRDDSRRDRDDITRDRNENFSRSGNRSSDSFKKSPQGGFAFKVVTETDGDLFKAPTDFSLAHCVAEDLRMGSGIAVGFRQQFKCVDELLEQRKRVGEVAFLKDKSRFIFYLITKQFSSGKPQWDNFRATVMELRDLCTKHAVKNLAMPRLGCGLDRLDWRNVKRLLEDTFTDSGVAITVYNFQQNDDDSATLKSKSSFYIVHEKKNLIDINPETGLIFLCSEDTITNRTFDSLDKKHKIMYEYRMAKRVVGEVITIQKGKEYLYGLVVKKSEKDPMSWVNLDKCLRKLRSSNSKEKYGYFGLEAFRDEKDPLTMEKVVTLFRNLFGGVGYKMELYICWPEDLQRDHRWDEPTTPNTSSK